jgi:cytochrome P450
MPAADKNSPTNKLRTPGYEPIKINNESPLTASVRKIQRSPSSTLNKKTDLLGLLINSSTSGIAADDTANTLSKSDIRDQILTFLLAGYDKTSSSVLWVIYELCIHPDIQARCHAEIDSILESKKYQDHNQGNPIGYMDFYAINKFIYMVQVIKETLRLHPVIGTISRQCHTDCDVGAYKFKAGTTVLVSLVALHRHSEYWEDPHDFNPDRFAKENICKTIRHAFQYIPLGKGQTQCIGQNFAVFEILCIMGSLLSRFSFSLPTKDINAIVEEELYTIEPKNLNVIVTLRQH